MGVISLDSYIRKTFPNSVRYTKPDEKVPTPFHLLALDANPFVYASVVKAFETDCILKQHDHLSYDEKVSLVFQYTWEHICEIVNVIDCQEIFIAFDGVAPLSKQAQQRHRRYPRSLPAQDEFDTTHISCGTRFMHDLCGFIQYKIQEVNGWGKRKFVFSGHTSPGEGEHNCLDYIRGFTKETKVCMYGPDGDLIMLGLACPQDFYLFKTDYNTKDDFDKRMYTIRMKWIKEALVYPISRGKKLNFNDATKSFVFLGAFLGNDFVPRLEIFDLFINGIDDLYLRYEPIGQTVMKSNKLDLICFTHLLEKLAKEEPYLLSKRTKNDFPLLEKHSVSGKLDFAAFRKDYYKDWVKISEDEIEIMCFNYLDTIWWCWLYYTETCPTPNHFYRYHYPPFCCDLAQAIKKWVIPTFQWTPWRTPFQQLVAILPPNRKELLPAKYHNFFQGAAFPKVEDIIRNSQGKDPKFETVLEIPFFTETVDIQHVHKHSRNILTGDRVFVPSENKYNVKTKWGTCITNLDG
jgi:5'-3' exonuclease